MTRKGSKKARTGCITCKSRKVKCDETKPACDRCNRTGRTCQGYIPVKAKPVKPSSTVLCLHKPEAIPGVRSPSEIRALQYFCEIAGPYLSGAIDPYFMSKLVMQFTGYEPAARHSVIAISTLCERLNSRSSDQYSRLQYETFALRHYNAAIHDVRQLTSSDNQPVVLLVCILFICIETLNSNRAAVINHCKHGFSLLKYTTSEYAWARQHLLPLFRRLSIMAFLYSDNRADFPDLYGLEHPVPSRFSDFVDAQLMLDDLFSRTLRLVRRGDPYRINPQNRGLASRELVLEQENIRISLDQWQNLLEDFEARPLSPLEGHSTGIENLTKTLRYLLLTRFASCKAWLNTALGTELYDYERDLDAFDSIFDDIGITDPEFRASFRQSPSFMCDAGYLPTITLTSASCFHLESRLAALNLKPVPGLPRETLCLQAHDTGCPGLESVSEDSKDISHSSSEYRKGAAKRIMIP
ncbi:C6 zinc finger protein [Colletotrichum truncatum]|uniref:C6 zinc finger protein n=1 Tax=Colletotrichum truncatum TaxID=5467 RepID=A0ACC3ZGG2_COLTU|nr:C6 zinc finger protein [Colletotrichum truncatum]KAF6784706.1 C6 zinc finger protein [Colletotrichum truncatum]